MPGAAVAVPLNLRPKVLGPVSSGWGVGSVFGSGSVWVGGGWRRRTRFRFIGLTAATFTGSTFLVSGSGSSFFSSFFSSSFFSLSSMGGSGRSSRRGPGRAKSRPTRPPWRKTEATRGAAYLDSKLTWRPSPA